MSELLRKGLSESEVIESRKLYGQNILTPPERDPWWKLYLEKYEDPVIRILLISAIIAIVAGFFNGKYVEGLGIVVAILLATTLAFVNEFKANKEFDILNKVNDDIAVKVIRDSKYTTVPKKDIVVGDVVIVEIGEEIPADGKVLEAVSFQVNESKFTGETVPVHKYAVDKYVKENSEECIYPPTEILKGTLVVDGHSVYEVTRVGDKTEIGKIGQQSAEDSEEKSPLNKQLERLSKQIGVAGLFIAVLTYTALVIRDLLTGAFSLSAGELYMTILLHISMPIILIKVWMPIIYDFFEWIKIDKEPPAWLEKEGLLPWLKALGTGVIIYFAFGYLGTLLKIVPASPLKWLPSALVFDLLSYFMIAVTIIVVAVPEGLAMSVTLSLAYSMRKMTASNNLVRKMDACETIGATNVICSDKTGTLTLNEMRVNKAIFPVLNNHSLKVDKENNYMQLIAEAISSNSTANLSHNNDETSVLGNPTEGALLLWLNDNRIDYIQVRGNFNIDYQYTFSTDRKYMSTLGKSEFFNTCILYTKGAPEIILDMCNNILQSDGEKGFDELKCSIQNELKEFQRKGMRTLAFAYKKITEQHKEIKIEEINKDLTWLGFVAIADPIRSDVPDAVKACKEASIMVKIVTGDNSETAVETAKQIGLWNEGAKNSQHLNGCDFEKMSDSEIRKILPELKVLSRARPMDKLRLVKLLKEMGMVVAVTGDGTNDAPALNHADVGLAMGKTGTSIAKEASDIILLDDSFKSIVNAVMWGRSLYENIQRFILFQLTINVAACGIALLGPFIGIQLPFTVTQMLWINLIMDTFAALALATEPPHWNVMKRKPRNSQANIVTNKMAKNIFGVGGIFLALLAGMLLFINSAMVIEKDKPSYALTLFFTIFVMMQFWNLFNAKNYGSNQTAFHNIWKNKGFVTIATAIFLGQIFIVQFGGEVFRTVPLSLNDWIYVVCGTSLVLLIGEIKRLFNRLKKTD